MDEIVKEWSNTRLINAFQSIVVRRYNEGLEWTISDEEYYEAVKRELYRRLDKE